MSEEHEKHIRDYYRLNYYPNSDKHRLRHHLTEEEKDNIMKLLNANPMTAGFIMKTLGLEVPMKILTDFIGKNDDIEMTNSTPRGYKLRNSEGDIQDSLF